MVGWIRGATKSAYAFFASERCGTIAQHVALLLAVLLVLVSMSLAVQDLARESVIQHDTQPARTVG
jgi:hypothetical protein